MFRRDMFMLLSGFNAGLAVLGLAAGSVFLTSVNIVIAIFAFQEGKNTHE